jgi:hypothetical protein
MKLNDLDVRREQLVKERNILQGKLDKVNALKDEWLTLSAEDKEIYARIHKSLVEDQTLFYRTTPLDAFIYTKLKDDI